MLQIPQWIRVQCGRRVGDKVGDRHGDQLRVTIQAELQIAVGTDAEAVGVRCVRRRGCRYAMARLVVLLVVHARQGRTEIASADHAGNNGRFVTALGVQTTPASHCAIAPC